MKYKIEAWVYHEAVDEFETDSLEEAREWWRKNWKEAENSCNAFCKWFVDGKYQDIPQKIELEGDE